MPDPKDLIGKHILIGLVYLKPDGEVKKKMQVHGIIKAADDQVIQLDQAHGQGEFNIPFDPEMIPGEPGGVYTLESTGEEVTGVDYVSTWTIHPPEHVSD